MSSRSISVHATSSRNFAGENDGDIGIVTVEPESPGNGGDNGNGNRPGN